jgi:hypothetical protein
MASSSDVPLLVSSTNASSERRVSPSWTLAQLKSRLEPITGIPASAQSLRLGSLTLEAVDEESTLLSSFPLQHHAELHVSNRKPQARLFYFHHAFLLPEPLERSVLLLFPDVDKSKPATCLRSHPSQADQFLSQRLYWITAPRAFAFHLLGRIAFQSRE